MNEPIQMMQSLIRSKLKRFEIRNKTKTKKKTTKIIIINQFRFES